MKFNFVFSSLLAISILSGLTAIGISAQPNLTPEQKQIVSTCLDTWKITVGAIAGLVGGHTLNHSNGNEEKQD